MSIITTAKRKLRKAYSFWFWHARFRGDRRFKALQNAFQNIRRESDLEWEVYHALQARVQTAGELYTERMQQLCVLRNSNTKMAKINEAMQIILDSRHRREIN